MIKGSLKGVFDGETAEIDWNKPGVVIDISRIRASDAGVALTMTCGQALVDQILTFTDHQWVRILDECWRQIRYPHICVASPRARSLPAATMSLPGRRR